MTRLAKRFAPLLLVLIALVPATISAAETSPTKAPGRPEPTHQTVNPFEAAHKAAALQHRRDVARWVKAVKHHNEEVWYAAVRNNQFAAYINAVVANQQREAAERARQAQQAQQARAVSIPIPEPIHADPGTTNFGDLARVVQCIKDHESGNYSESSHPGSGSGAYQFIPGTWRTWSARAGYGGYMYAYQAPPAVQDAVLHYTLTHGGAGNWSNRWGNDPCTAGLAGGG